MTLIDRDAKDVRVVDHSGDGIAALLPVGAAVDRLPRQMPGAKVDHIRVARVDRTRLDVSYLVVPGGSYATPGGSPVVRSEGAVELRIIARRTYDEQVRIRRRKRQRADGELLCAVQEFPVLAAVCCFEYSAFLVARDGPHSDVDRSRVVRIYFDAVHRDTAPVQTWVESFPTPRSVA